jgi:hypothetical protein
VIETSKQCGLTAVAVKETILVSRRERQQRHGRAAEQVGVPSAIATHEQDVAADVLG